MPESYVYINAPTLDNADQSKFILNQDFQYVQAGETSNGEIAQFPLYQKFLNSEWNSSLGYSSLPRTNFKPGLWAQHGEEADNGGDYAIGNTAQIYSRLFQVGNLKQIRVRLYNKDYITADNRNSENHPPQITDYETAVPRIALFQNEFYANGTCNMDSYVLTAFANFESYNITDGAVYTLQQDFPITGKALNTLNYCYVIVFLPSANDWSNENLSIGRVFTFNQLRSLGVGNNNKKVGVRSVPRGSLDNRSYICGSSNTTSTFSSGQSRLLDFDFLIDVDLINEYISVNSKNHHLDIADVVELNRLRYSAPAINVSNNTRKSTVAKKIFLSHFSLTRGRNITAITGKNISYIQIPFQYTTNSADYETSSLKGNEIKNLINNQRQIEIANGHADGTEPSAEEYTTCDNIIAYSSFGENMVYEATFNNGKGFKYTGYGLWIKGKGANSGAANNIGVHYYINNDDNSKYSYSADDKMESVGNFEIVTPQIDIIFDYKTRKDWFDYIEFKESNSSGIISGNTISLGDWRIAVNPEGHLEIYHITATTAADRSIFYIPGTSNRTSI
jgi:hypothetical protein